MGNEEIVGKEHACCSGKRRTERKGHNLVAGCIDAHRISGNLIFMNGKTGPAIGGILEVFDEKRIAIMIQKARGKVVRRGIPIRPDAPPTYSMLRMQMRMISPRPKVAIVK